MNVKNTVFFLFLILLLQACSTFQPTEEKNQLPKIQPSSTLESWLVKGKLSIKGHNQLQSSAFSWRQNKDTFDITINGFLGYGSSHIFGDRALTTLESSGRTPLQSNSPSALSQQIFGQAIPVESLWYWIRGIPDPNLIKHNTVFNSNGSYANFEQMGWALKFRGETRIDNFLLPSKIYAKKETVELKIIIKQWQPGTTQ